MATPSSTSSITIWDYKPWWCQPWSIILTGFGLIGGSWFVLHRAWVSVLVAIPITVWMVYFVWIYPKLILQSGLLIPPQDQAEAAQSEPSIPKETQG